MKQQQQQQQQLQQQQIRKFYVLHFVCQKKTNIFLQKKKSKKEIPVQIPQNIFLQNIFASRPQKTATKKKRLIEEKAGCIYQNYKGYQNDEQHYRKSYQPHVRK